MIRAYRKPPTDTIQSRMQKLLISIAAIASLGLSGCSTLNKGVDDVASAIPRALNKSSLIYRPTIQQGNKLSQEQVNQLKPGMTKRQVRFVLGSPMLQDVFHDNRWDYPYTIGVGSTPSKIEDLALYFKNDQLVRIAGYLHPQPPDEQKPAQRSSLVDVPNWTPKNKTLFGRLFSSVGLGSKDEE